MVNRNSPAYKIGGLVGKIILIGLDYVLGKRWGRKPMDKGFSQKGN